jgi:hypothetical protein
MFHDLKYEIQTASCDKCKKRCKAVVLSNDIQLLHFCLEHLKEYFADL